MRRADRDVAFTAYVAARQGPMRRLAFALCGDWHRADDMLQMAFTKLYLAWPRLQRDGVEDAYLRRTLVRVSIDESRRAWRRRERAGLDGYDRAAPPTGGIEESDAILTALTQLPIMQRKVVVLRFWMDLSVDETARDLGVAPGTVKSHTSRAMVRLRELLAEPVSEVR